MAKAQLTDGSTVELPKDCECKTHEGPHWLHMDRLHRDRNRALAVNGNMRGYAVEELHRLREKGYEMARRDIERLITEDDHA